MATDDKVVLSEHQEFSGNPENVDKEVQAHIAQAAQEELHDAQESPWSSLRKNPKAIVLLLIILSTGITNGIELSMSGSMLGSQAFCKVMGAYDSTSKTYVVAPGHVSSWTAAQVPAQFLGLYLASILGDRIGRKYVLQITMGGVLLGAIVETISRNWKDWLASKFIMGLATGMLQVCTATYVAEVAPREIRGAALIAFQVFTNIGNLFSAVALDLSSDTWTDPSDTRQYKVPLYVMIALPIILSVGIFTILPESPAWLVLKDKLPRAMKELKKQYPYMSTEELELELAKLQYTVKKENEEDQVGKDASWLECFRGTNLRRTLVATIPGAAWVQSGNVVFLLTAYFFAIAGQSNALQSTVIVQCTGIAFNVIAIILVENKRIGRWLIYVVGLFIQTGGMMIVGAVGAHWGATPGSSATGSNLLIGGVIIANMGCQLGPQAVCYLYAAESGSSRLRSKTTSIGQSVGAILGQVSGVYFPFMLAGWGPLLGFFFGGCGVFFLIISILFVPDYTGRSHAQVDELYIRKISARKFASTECTGDYGRDLLDEL